MKELTMRFVEGIRGLKQEVKNNSKIVENVRGDMDLFKKEFVKANGEMKKEIEKLKNQAGDKDKTKTGKAGEGLEKRIEKVEMMTGELDREISEITEVLQKHSKDFDKISEFSGRLKDFKRIQKKIERFDKAIKAPKTKVVHQVDKKLLDGFRKEISDIVNNTRKEISTIKNIGGDSGGMKELGMFKNELEDRLEKIERNLASAGRGPAGKGQVPPVSMSFLKDFKAMKEEVSGLKRDKVGILQHIARIEEGMKVKSPSSPSKGTKKDVMSDLKFRAEIAKEIQEMKGIRDEILESTGSKGIDDILKLKDEVVKNVDDMKKVIEGIKSVGIDTNKMREIGSFIEDFDERITEIEMFLRNLRTPMPAPAPPVPPPRRGGYQNPPLPPRQERPYQRKNLSEIASDVDRIKSKLDLLKHSIRSKSILNTTPYSRKRARDPRSGSPVIIE